MPWSRCCAAFYEVCSTSSDLLDWGLCYFNLQFLNEAIILGICVIPSLQHGLVLFYLHTSELDLNNSLVILQLASNYFPGITGADPVCQSSRDDILESGLSQNELSSITGDWQFDLSDATGLLIV